MAHKVILDNVTSFVNEISAANKINKNMRRIEAAIENTLSRDGSAPNAMHSNLDMNDHTILNLPTPTDVDQPATKGYVDSLFSGTPGTDFLTDADISVTVHPYDASLVGHTADISDAHNASAISFTPAGTIAATDVQAAIAELDTETQAALATKEPADADILKADTSDNLTVGFTATAENIGTISSGTVTPDPATGNLKRYVNNGAHTLAPPSAAGDYTIIVQITNSASAGAVTTSGFTAVTGDSLTTTNGDDFFGFITKLNSFSHLHIVALQ